MTPRSSARRRSILLAAATVATSLLLAGCGRDATAVAPLDGGTAATPTEAPSSEPATTTSSTLTTSADSPSAGSTAVQVVGAVTRRSISYKIFDVTVEGADLAAVEPDTFGDPTATPTASATTYAFVKVAVHNRLNFVTDFVATDEAFLDLGDGAPVAMTKGLGQATDVVDHGATVHGWFVFPVPAGTTLDGASLRFGKPGFQNELLPLTGAVPVARWPHPLTLASPGPVTTRDGSTVATYAVAIEKAYLTDYVAYDADGHSYTTKQALTDRRKLYVGFTLKVAKAPAGSPSVLWAHDYLRLMVDGELQSGVAEITDSYAVQKGTTQHVRYAFDVPTTGTVQLVWGSSGGATKLTAVPVR